MLGTFLTSSVGIYSFQEVLFFKQVNGSPLYLASQLSILSIANQDLVKSLTLKEVSLLLNLYSLIPMWTIILVPARTIGASILSLCGELNR